MPRYNRHASGYDKTSRDMQAANRLHLLTFAPYGLPLHVDGGLWFGVRFSHLSTAPSRSFSFCRTGKPSTSRTGAAGRLLFSGYYLIAARLDACTFARGTVRSPGLCYSPHWSRYHWVEPLPSRHDAPRQADGLPPARDRRTECAWSAKRVFAI